MPCASIPSFSSKRLRSCLSLNRSCPNSPALRPESQGGKGQHKRVKMVRWQEMNGCAVTSFHDTYSQEEYDRSPLDPPTSAERDCVLPERDSRCFATARECFLMDWSDEEDSPTSTSDASDSSVLHTPPCTEASSEDGTFTERREEEEGDGVWNECMQRRRMMFAHMCSAQEGERQPEFEGYRSVGATLAELLKSIGCDDSESGGGEEENQGRGEEGIGMYGLGSVDHVETEVGTPSLVSTEDSEVECSIASPIIGKGLKALEGEGMDMVGKMSIPTLVIGDAEDVETRE
ncbi:uncharacterized protein L203_102368 [Cryptococcus depauperatus CBS 7841]|uniref:Uncharacterized protein n=1 Tax=Cryptococcus depauperatus CBS 7841 TaxID=1295531 RepID=A0A1E3IAY9_9TREE|nr:hypothetical protein L203_04825 [Cryptococcus depauperatus CBS 7841]